MKAQKLLWQLFKETFILSAFTLGGGYVIISLMQKRFVEELKWLEEKEMLDLVAIAQTTPGAVAINTSIAVGYRIKGFVGALVTTIATSLPPMIILSLLYYIYESFKSNEIIQLLMSGMQIGVIAVVLDVVITMVLGIHKEKNWVNWLVFIGTLGLAVIYKVNILLLVIMMTFIGITLNKLQKRGV